MAKRMHTVDMVAMRWENPYVTDGELTRSASWTALNDISKVAEASG